MNTGIQVLATVIKNKNLNPCHCYLPCSCRPLLIATYNPEEGPLREHLLDRIAVTLSADVPSSFEDRVKAIDAALRFQDKPKDVMGDSSDLTDALRTSVGMCKHGGMCCYSTRVKCV